MAPKKTEKDATIDIIQFHKASVTYAVRGNMPLICNRMSQKAMRELFMPKGRKTAADKAARLKHVPLEEFRASPYTLKDPQAPTYIAHLATAFKQAMAGAALDIPGAKKTQIGRLLWVRGERLPIYGIPQLGMSVVRSADMNKTPDIRTRAVIPEWATFLTVEFSTPLLNETAVSNLLATAGITQGIGDWRPEKGSGTYGSFEVVNADEDEDFQRIIAEGGRAAQIAAMEDPAFYDDETEDLYAYYMAEAPKRGFDPETGLHINTGKANKKANGHAEASA